MKSRWLMVVLAACLMVSAGGFALAQGGTFTVVAVLPSGAVVLKGPDGAVRQYDVPAGTTFNANGNPGTPVSGLRNGMTVTGVESGIANWKATNVLVQEELNAEIVNKAGNTMLIRGANGLTHRYEWVAAGDIVIIKDGKAVDMSSINVGDRITGMVVQKAMPGKAAPAMAAAPDTSAADAAARKAAADKAAADAAARKAAADKAAADRAAAARAAADKAAADAAAKAAADKAAADAAAAAAASKHAASKKKLPKTASEIPLAGMAGALALAAGAGLTAIRKSRASK